MTTTNSAAAMQTTFFFSARRAVALATLVTMTAGGMTGCKRKSSAVEPAPSTAATASVAPKVVLPPEPAPPMANLAGEVPALEAKLAADKLYGAIWTAPRADLNLYLTYVSELLAEGGVDAKLLAAAKAKKINESAIPLYLVHSRIGRYPDDFTKRVSAVLDASKADPRLGTWSPGTSAIHDWTALAAWMRPEDPRYLRARLDAKKSGPMSWHPAIKDRPALRPWLVNERAALERLAAITTPTAEESARLAEVIADSKKPRQPKLGEEFKLGEFTYVVKSVDVVDSVGTGYSKKTAGEDARYVLVSFTIRNEGNETATVLTDDFRIVDEGGREFRPSSEANTALVMSGGKDLGLTELQPGLKKTMSTAFEVPEATAKGVFTLVVPEKGAFGTGSVRITLR